MSASSTFREVPGSVLDHSAAAAWLTISDLVPTSVEVLTSRRGAPSRKTEVFRLHVNGEAVLAKRSRASSVRTEALIYTDVLPQVPISSVRCYGTAPDPDPAKAWLFVEPAEGVSYSPGLAEHRHLASEWVGTLHAATSGLDLAGVLPAIGVQRYLRYLDRAVEFMHDGLRNPALDQGGRGVVENARDALLHLRAGWRRVEDDTAGFGPCLVHGDLIGKNARVRGDGKRATFVAFDWEAAGWGLPAEDVAGLDPARYQQHAVAGWPDLTVERAAHLERVGTALQAIALLEPTSRALAYEWLGTTIEDIGTYHATLVRAARTLDWR